ncbi:MAG TPA: ATP-binding protein [Candidatus Nitrosopolaris sp.]|nr:ATP-binding protein [Candidatus Nitrosopolaris sp.]
MNKTALNKPVLICLYGFPGAGKSYIARNLTGALQTALISADRIRMELFERPRFDAQENAVINHLMNYMADEFLAAGISAIYDTNLIRTAQRHKLRELARKHKAGFLLLWIQIDAESAFARTQERDRRTSDDRYAQPQTRTSFDQYLAGMQNPQDEDYLVLSGKHSFITQKAAILNRLYQMGLVDSGSLQGTMTKPGLINLVPNPQAGRVDLSRRNINIS